MALNRNIIVAGFAVLLSSSLAAQNTTTVIDKNNIIKVNLSALVFKNVSLQYERKVGKHISVAANVHNMAFAKLPFLSTVENFIDDPDVPVDKLKLGAFGVTPEVRFYVGKKGALHGFYIAPFASYNRYKTDLPIKYDNDTKTGIFSGDLKTITGGLLFGAQWNLSKTLSLDWWIAGPNYGASKGDLGFNASLTATEQNDIRNQIADFKDDAPFDAVESYNVNSNGAFIKVKGPWAGLRGLGINLGIRF